MFNIFVGASRNLCIPGTRVVALLKIYLQLTADTIQLSNMANAQYGLEKQLKKDHLLAI